MQQHVVCSSIEGHPAGGGLFKFPRQRMFRRTGIVKWFNVKKGYGFATLPGTQEDVFLYWKAIVRNNPKKYHRSVGDGEVIEFELVCSSRGLRGENVTGPNWSDVRGHKLAKDRRNGRPNHHRGRQRRPRGRRGDGAGPDDWLEKAGESRQEIHVTGPLFSHKRRRRGTLNIMRKQNGRDSDNSCSSTGLIVTRKPPAESTTEESELEERSSTSESSDDNTPPSPLHWSRRTTLGKHSNPLNQPRSAVNTSFISVVKAIPMMQEQRSILINRLQTGIDRELPVHWD